MPAATGMIFDFILLAALGVVMYRAWQLSRQFTEMQANRAAFEQLIQALNIATQRAEGAIMGLREAATESAEGLQSKINAARALSDELEIVVQAGDSLAERLQNLAAKSRPAMPSTSTFEEEPHAPAKPATAPRTKAEKELLEAVKAKQKS
ncbi:MAG TPA: DUF6468 domain-containing protein [Alphaproteobacteria bacterium]|jgi:predicted negative regulator of RcsB-dependent stress response|nr:DUF6468 domain-containing protein [Alphaproteobacteria bacterium]